MSSSVLEVPWEVARPGRACPIRYAQCWEDADVLLEALNVRPGAVCLSVASGGDNTLALLTKSPARVIAVDTNPAQLACLELRVAAYRELNHPELLELMGSVPSSRRGLLYDRCRQRTSGSARTVWDPRRREIERYGAAGAGRFERYFRLFRSLVLPIVAGREPVRQLLAPRARRDRERDYACLWEGWPWRVLSRLFFSRWCMGSIGRDTRCFRYAQGEVARPVLERMRHAFTVLDPSRNPYLGWILTGAHANALPYSLRAENFEVIRANLDRLEWRCQDVGGAAKTLPAGSIDAFNLSDIFEYMSREAFERTLAALARAGSRGSRLAYWNVLVPRSRPDALADRLRPLRELSERLHGKDNAFFYGAFVLEEVA